MAQKVRIALDAMGGDIGPAVVVPGADLSLARHPDTEFVLFGDEAVVAPLLDARPRLKAASRLVHTDVVVRDGRQAEPGAAPGPLEILDVARDRRGEEGRGRRRGLGRQHRRPDGDGEVQPAHHGGDRAPGDRGAVADAQGRLGRARCRRLDRRRCRASGRPRRDGQRDGARAVRSRAADRRPAQHRRRGGEGPGGGARGRAHPARGEPAVPRLCRLRRGRRHRQGHGRRGGDRRLLPATSRSRPRRGPRGRSASICAPRCRARCARASAICWRAPRSRRCATRWTRARRMAACSSASTASSSRAMAAPTRKALPPRSTSATTWCATSCSTRSARRSSATPREEAAASKVEAAS